MTKNRKIPKILIVRSTGIPRERIEDMEKKFAGECQFVVAEDRLESIKKRIRGVDALIGIPRPLFSERLVGLAGRNLRWIHVPGAGCEEFLVPSVIAKGVFLTTGKIIQGPSVSDHAVALLLCLTRNLHYVLRGNAQKAPRPLELRGKTALVIGCGGIGQLIAQKVSAFGMKVYGIDPQYIPILKEFERVYFPEQTRTVLGIADAVFMSAPLTNESRKMMRAQEFAAMKKTAYFINVSRGETVDFEALTNALRCGQIAGAGLDVTDPEPLPKDHPIMEMDNVIVSPHIAGPSDHNRQRSQELIIQNIERFVQGKSLLNPVNKSLGY